MTLSTLVNGQSKLNLEGTKSEPIITDQYSCYFYSDIIKSDNTFHKYLKDQTEISMVMYCTNPEEILTLLSTPGFERPEQWQAQIQALIQRKADVRVYSSLDNDTLRATHLTPCADISATIAEELGKHGPDARVAVLPQGPLTIPYLESAA